MNFVIVLQFIHKHYTSTKNWFPRAVKKYESAYNMLHGITSRVSCGFGSTGCSLNLTDPVLSEYGACSTGVEVTRWVEALGVTYPGRSWTTGTADGGGTPVSWRGAPSGIAIGINCPWTGATSPPDILRQQKKIRAWRKAIIYHVQKMLMQNIISDAMHANRGETYRTET